MEHDDCTCYPVLNAFVCEHDDCVAHTVRLTSVGLTQAHLNL